jgi:hypothetical protein
MDRAQLRNLSAADAAVAMRSYARRFRELLAPLERSAHDAGTLATDLGAIGRSGWSVLGLADAVADHLATLDAAMRRALESEDPAFTSLFSAPEPPGPAAVSSSAAAARGHLEGVVTGLAERIERTSSRDWVRPVVVDGRATDAHELLREAVAYGRNALDQLAAVVEETRRSGGQR